MNKKENTEKTEDKLENATEAANDARKTSWSGGKMSVESA